MYKVLCVISFKWILLPFTLAIMGSPPTNLPACLHGGTLSINEERYGCTCPDSRMDRQCKLTLVSIDSTPIEMAYGPLLVELKDTTTLHVGLTFITNDPVGVGSLLTIRSNTNTVQMNIFLNNGRVGLSMNVAGATVSIQFSALSPVLNDNAWHNIDVFLEADAQKNLRIYLMVDWCRYAKSGVCVMQQSVSSSSTSFQLGGTIQLGSDVGTTTGRFDGCIDKVTVANEVLDFYNATWGQKSNQGCQRSQQGCQKDGQLICGTHGVCLNALRETDMLTCQCQLGYQPDPTQAVYPHRWPCNSASSVWSTTGMEYNAKFLGTIPARFRISLRTRTPTFMAFAVASWKLYLKVSNGVPELDIGQTKISLTRLDVSDGNWHLFDVKLTESFISLQVDALDKNFYAVRRLTNVTFPSGPADIVIARDANGTCLDDAWIDFVDKWPNFEKEYPLVLLDAPKYTRHIQWPTTGRQQSCDTGTSLCSVQSMCHSSATCIDEWRGYRCECSDGLSPDENGRCISAYCVPNPCVNGNCSVPNVTTNRNFSCTCEPGWQGDVCSEPTLGTAELSWWWILLIILLILLIVIVIVIVICCCKRKARKKAELEQQNAVLDNDQFGLDSQINDPWDSGEKDFMGPIDYSFLQTDQRIESVPSVKPNGIINTGYVTRDHGQKTSERPPWEKFEGQENPPMNLDQVLEYGYEGYDGKPPPGFCATEPPAFAGQDDDIDELDENELPEIEVPSASRMSYTQAKQPK